MSANLLLFSSHLITKEELADVILQAGGMLTQDPHAMYLGGIHDGDAYIWIDPIPCYDGVFDYEGNPLDEKGFVLLQQAKELLGGEFQTWLYITLGKDRPGSHRLAVRFALTACQRWPCVIDNDQYRLFSCKEIAQLHEEGGTFYSS
jgi:hypothetical protein